MSSPSSSSSFSLRKRNHIPPPHCPPQPPKRNHLPPPHRLLPPPPAIIKSGLKKGPWTPQEDHLLTNFINKEGEGGWRTLPKKAGLLRCGKSCRLRWMNYLRPSVKRGHIAADEEDLILRLHRLLGNRWSLIAGRIPGRTDNEIKNYWNTHLSKKMISQGIDPTTHKPLDSNTNFINSSSSPSFPNIASIIKLPGFTDMGRHESGQITSTNDDEEADMMINYCNDEDEDKNKDKDKDEDEDVLSFLNSLMNEDDDLISPANEFNCVQPYDLQLLSSDGI